MKKIYMILAAISLLTLSLNAQMLPAVDRSQLHVAQTNSTRSFHDMIRGIKGMSSILPEVNPNGVSSSKGQLRAPLKINSDETTVGPFTGDNFDPTNGLGFGNAYANAQMVLIETDLIPSDYSDYIGKEIIGFRLALAGDATQTVQVGQFIAWPTNSNDAWDQNNQHTWSIGELTTDVGDPYTQYERITSTSDLESGAEYLIVCENNSVAFNGALTTLDATGNTISVTPNNGIIASTATVDAATFTITANGNYYIVRSKSGYSIGYTRNNSNGLLSSTTQDYNNTITINNGNASIRCTATTARYLRYNSNNTDRRFRYYQTSTGQNIQLYKKVTVTPTAPAYVGLQAGQWHEFYLDNPVVFNVDNDNAGLSLGYTYIQYPTGTTGQNLFPIAVNPQSTTHDHYAYLTTTTGANGNIIITVPSYNTMFQTITVTDNTTGNTLTSWSSSEATVTDGTYTFYNMPTGWTLSGVYMFTYTTGGYTFGYLSSESQASITIDSSLLNGSTNVSVAISGAALEAEQYVDVNGDSRNLTSGYLFNQTWNPVDLSGGSSTSTGYNYFDFSQYGDLAVQLIFKNENKTPMPEITYVVNGDNVVVTATGQGTVTLTIGDQTQTGTGSASITLPRNETTYSVTATATAQDGDKEESDPATQVVTVPFLQTATPVITTSTEGETVTITATGAGTVTLTVDGQTVTGEGSASITLTAGVVSRNVTAEATAKEDGKAVSETATLPVTIPAGEGWLVMDGTYNNPDDLLSFLAGGEDIMMIDQFLASTLNNDHPDHYTYTLRETVNNEEMTSSPVTIPIYKTSSTMEGFYTYDQVMSDTDMHLKANVINSEMDYGVVPDRNALYYNLYRGDKNAAYPVIDIPHRVSQLQKYDEMDDNGIVHYFFTETYPSGIAPKYNHVGNETVERLDTNYVQGQRGDELSYVPVIWTSGLYTAREDGKNNSYGSDIKRETLGGVDVIIAGSKSDQRKQGQWTASNDTTYCVYTPVMTITGIPPIEKMDNDGDVSTYYPFMYRAWCTYSKARDFVHNADGQLTDAGPMQVPFLMATDVNDQVISHIGREWQPGEGRLDWAFGVPLTEDPHNVGFVIRFYYRKAVTNPTDTPNDSPNGAPTYRLGDGPAEEYYVVETSGDGSSITTAINELFNGPSVVSQTYYNVQGMQSSTPFDGINIVVTRYSDGSTRTSKVVR